MANHDKGKSLEVSPETPKTITISVDELEGMIAAGAEAAVAKKDAEAKRNSLHVAGNIAGQKDPAEIKKFLDSEPGEYEVFASIPGALMMLRPDVKTPQQDGTVFPTKPLLKAEFKKWNGVGAELAMPGKPLERLFPWSVCYLDQLEHVLNGNYTVQEAKDAFEKSTMFSNGTAFYGGRARSELRATYEHMDNARRIERERIERNAILTANQAKRG